MKIAILSDSHDHTDNVKKAISRIKKLGVDALIHLGDHCAPFIIKEFSQLEMPQYHIQGNNVGDAFVAGQLFERFSHMSFEGVYCEHEFAGVSFAFTHYPDIALRVAQSGVFDVVCYGHTHVYKEENVDDCLLLNPGSLMPDDSLGQFVVYDTEDDSVSVHTL